MLGRAFEVIAILVALGAAGGLALRLWRAREEPAPEEQESDPTYPALAAGLTLLVIAATCEAWFDPPSEVTPAMWGGRGLVLGAALLTLWGRRVMGPSYAPTAHHPRPAEQVIVHAGPYRFFKHPQYVGNFGSLAGLVLALDLRWSWLALLPFAAALTWRIRREEAWLRATHGEEWREGRA